MSEVSQNYTPTAEDVRQGHDDVAAALLDEAAEGARRSATTPDFAPCFYSSQRFVDAFQMTAANRENEACWPSWLRQEWEKDYDEGALYPLRGGALGTRNDKGEELRIELDDWIVRLPSGDLRPCNPDLFAAIFNAVGAA